MAYLKGIGELNWWDSEGTGEITVAGIYNTEPDNPLVGLGYHPESVRTRASVSLFRQSEKAAIVYDQINRQTALKWTLRLEKKLGERPWSAVWNNGCSGCICNWEDVEQTETPSATEAQIGLSPQLSYCFEQLTHFLGANMLVCSYAEGTLTIEALGCSNIWEVPDPENYLTELGEHMNAWIAAV